MKMRFNPNECVYCLKSLVRVRRDQDIFQVYCDGCKAKGPEVETPEEAAKVYWGLLDRLNEKVEEFVAVPKKKPRNSKPKTHHAWEIDENNVKFCEKCDIKHRDWKRLAREGSGPTCKTKR